MPQAAAYVGGQFASWAASEAFLAGASAATAQTIGTIAYVAAYAATTLAISVGLAKVSSSLAGRPKQPDSGMASRTSVIRDSTLPRSIIYGTIRTGGVLTYINTSGNKNESLDIIVAIAGHQVNKITDVWFDDDKIANSEFASGDDGYLVIEPNKFARYARVNKYKGTTTDAPYAELLSRYPVELSADHKGIGVAHAWIALRRDSDVFPQGAPSNMTFLVEGARVYDPRKDTTNGGTGSHRIADPSTWEFSNNPALCAADYIIGGTITNGATRLNMRGFGADPARVDWASVITAANICDESVTIPGSTTQKRYTCDGMISTGNSPADNLEQILTCMMGQVTYASGKYKVFAGAYSTPVLTLNESDLAGPIEYAAGQTRSERYNAVKGSRYDTETGQLVEFLPRTSPDYETEDGGTRLYRDIELPFVLDEYRAQRIAQLIMRRSREQVTLIWRGNLGCLRVGVWETVSVTVAELGLSSKVFRCISRKFSPGASGDAIVELTLREEFSTTYTDPLTADYGDLTPATPADVPSDYVDVSDNLSVVFDPEFTYTLDVDELQYWDHTGTIGANGSTVELYPDGATDQTVRTKHLRTFPVQVTSAWTLSISLRYRVKTALTGATKQLTVNCYASNETFSATTLADSLTVDLSTAVEGAWYTVQDNLAYAPDGTQDRLRLEVKVAAADVSDGVVELDYLYGYRLSLVVDPGEVVQPVTGYLTNDACVLSADSGGTVASFATAVGQFRVFQGTTEVTSSATFAEVSETSCLGNINTAFGTPVAAQPAGYYRVTALSADTGQYKVSATYAGVTIEKTFSLSKSKAGTAGTGSLDVRLSRPACTIFAYADGTIPSSSFTLANGTASVWNGETNVTATATFSASATGCTGTVNTATNTPVNGQARGYYAVTALSENTGTLTITATHGGITGSATFAVSKAVAGVEIVSGLPVANLFDGRVVFLETDGKLYRYVTGTGWTAAVPTVDLIGQITSTQITDGSVTTPKLVANVITANEIAADAVTTNKILAGAITTDKILAGAITAAKIGASQITAEKILAGTITANEIGDQQITTAKLATASITSAKIGDLQVGTIAIANSAVTVSAYDDTNLGGGSVASLAGNWMPISGVDLVMNGIPSAGARVRLDIEFPCRSRINTDAQTFRIGIRRQDGLVFPGVDVYLPTGGGGSYDRWVTTMWSFIDDSPLPGSVIYSGVIYATATENIGQWREVRLMGTVLKK